MPVYEKAGPPVLDVVRDAIERYHPELDQFGVRIDVLVASAAIDDCGNPRGPGLTKHGREVLGLARVTTQKQRVVGAGDCELIVNGDIWPELSDEERLSLVDHELQHFELVKDKDDDTETAVALDDHLRPKLRIRPHDVELGLFEVTYHRHGEAGVEHKAFEEAKKTLAQQRLFDNSP